MIHQQRDPIRRRLQRQIVQIMLILCDLRIGDDDHQPVRAHRPNPIRHQQVHEVLHGLVFQKIRELQQIARRLKCIRLIDQHQALILRRVPDLVGQIPAIIQIICSIRPFPIPHRPIGPIHHPRLVKQLPHLRMQIVILLLHPQPVVRQRRVIFERVVRRSRVHDLFRVIPPQYFASLPINRRRIAAGCGRLPQSPTRGPHKMLQTMRSRIAMKLPFAKLE